MRESSRQSLWMVAASLLFACMGVCVKLAAASHSAAEIVFWRSSISLLIMIGVVRWQGVGFATPVLALQVFRGISGFISLTLYFIAIVLLPLATAVTLNYTSPLFLAIFLVAFAGMRLRPALLVALGVGLAGVAVVLKPTFHAELLGGGLAGLGSGLMAGLAYFNVRALAERGEPDARTVLYFALVSTSCSVVWMSFSEFQAVDRRDALLLAGVGIFATLAQLAMTRSYRVGKTLVSASLAYTAVIFASLFGMVLWGDELTGPTWLGMALIVASGVAATALSRRPARVPAAKSGECPTPVPD